MKAVRIFLLVLIVIGIGLLFTQNLWVPKLVNRIILSENHGTTVPVVSSTPVVSPVVYDNAEYGFNFSLPTDWRGYSIVKNTWSGYSSTTGAIIQTGPTILIRNPKWTAVVHHEDIPIMVFTIAQWNSYTAGDFSISAAPFNAGELARNNKYVFSLPPRWDFDYSQGYQEAENILTTKPLHPYNL